MEVLGSKEMGHHQFEIDCEAALVVAYGQPLESLKNLERLYSRHSVGRAFDVLHRWYDVGDLVTVIATSHRRNEEKLRLKLPMKLL